MTLSEELKWRGFINQTTYADLNELDKPGKLTFYHGFDASADSQTIGNLAAMMFDKVFIRHGHKAILVAGGSTSLVGDPGGKNEERPLQDEKTIAHNVRRAEDQLKQIMGKAPFTLVNNLDWTKDVTVLDFLRDIGKYYSITPLIQRDYIAKRLGAEGNGISYAEFSYTILQGFDYLHLYDTYNCTLQLGGADQWGNCLSGVELIRKARGKEVNVITLPLIINKATGQKFGKSEGGAVWLDPKKTSPNDFYQFWINVDDEGVGEYLKVFTELDKKQVGEIMTEFEKNRSTRYAQRRLAYEVTTIVHGEALAKMAEQNATTLTLKPHQSGSAAFSVKVGDKIIDSLVKSGLTSSKTEARQVLSSGGVYINDLQVTKEKFESSDFIDGLLKLRRGKTLQNSVVIKQD